MSLTIQINNLQALERLLGGDTQWEMDIRKSTAVAFARRHFENLPDDPKLWQELASLKAALKKLVDDRIRAEIATLKGSGYYEQWDLNADIKTSIQAEVNKVVQNMRDNAITEAVDKAVTAYFEKTDLDKRITKAVEDRLGVTISKVTKSKLESVDKNLNTRIGKLELE